MYVQNIGDFDLAVDANGITLSIMYHELGHAWVFDENAGDRTLMTFCGYHESYTTGKNANVCLWEYCKQSTLAEQVDFLEQSVLNPRFCEFHQYAFTNQLTPL